MVVPKSTQRRAAGKYREHPYTYLTFACRAHSTDYMGQSHAALVSPAKEDSLHNHHQSIPVRGSNLCYSDKL